MHALRTAPVHTSRLVRAADALLKAAASCGGHPATVPHWIIESHAAGRNFTEAEISEATAFLGRLGMLDDAPHR